MYSVDFTKQYSASAYAFKLNGNLVKITKNLYWKKDFMEASLLSFARYKLNNDEEYMQRYLQAAIPNKVRRNFLLSRLSPSKQAAAAWPSWFIQFAGYNVNDSDSIQLIQYDFIFLGNKVMLKDSSIIELSGR